MTPEMIYTSGLIICAATGAIALIAVVVLFAVKSRLNRKLDAEYGTRRRTKNG